MTVECVCAVVAVYNDFQSSFPPFFLFIEFELFHKVLELDTKAMGRLVAVPQNLP